MLKKYLLYSKPALSIKGIISKVLVSNTTGYLIRKIFNNKIPFRGFIAYTENPIISNTMVATIFFRGYESSEIRFINKYLNTKYPVVELGSSIGLVTLHIAQKTTKTIYCIEANPQLLDSLTNNLSNNGAKNCLINQIAIGNQGQNLYFEIGENHITGKLTVQKHSNSVTVECTSLSNILNNNNINEYILVCDIEGAESYILESDSVSLTHCKQIIIEAHEFDLNGKKMHYSYIKDKILSLNLFDLIDEYGPNYIFNAKDI